MTRAQFEEMTADLLDETIRITERTLAEAAEKYPGISQQISEVLLVGGSSRMPAVSEALRKEFGWDPRLADPDLAVAKGAALYAAGQTVRYAEKEDGGSGQAGADSASARGGPSSLAAPGPVTDEAVRAVADQTGLDEQDLRRLAQRTVVNVLPKAIGVKLVDTTKPGWEEDVRVRVLRRAPHRRPDPAAVRARALRRQHRVRSQHEIEIEIWEQAGGSPSPELSANHPLDDSGRITGLESFALPAGSPINIDINVDAEGTVHLQAVEPASSAK